MNRATADPEIIDFVKALARANAARDMDRLAGRGARRDERTPERRAASRR